MRVLAVLVCFVTLAAACKPKVGATCKVDKKEVCNEKSALVCHAGNWHEMTCRGPKACTGTDVDTECDQSLARAGEVCNIENNVTCSEDKKSSLLCKDKKWQLDEVCTGPLGCVLAQNEKRLDCDATIAKDGDKCSREKSLACSSDKKVKLECKGGKYTMTSNCRGDQGCRRIGDAIDCDDSLAVVGDMCQQADHYSCSVDGKSVVKCDGTRWALDETCKNRKSCKLSGDKVGCL
jgi:hypothetical protein